MSRSISRRTLLRGVGASLALPWLEAMGPMASWANTTTAAGNRTPNRMAFVYVPNGVHMQDWTPKTEGANFELPKILEPLAPVREHLTVLTGLTADKARPNGDGAGDHARAMAAFLTGAQPRKTDGTDIRAGVSVDQVAANRLGDRTRLQSLEIGADPSAMAGNCDSGYSCVYSSTVSWRSATTPLPKLVNPRLIFDRLFASAPDADRARRERIRRSILDFVKEDSASLTNQLGANDRRKLDEYFNAIRDIEVRIERAARMPAVVPPNVTMPNQAPGDYEEHLKLLGDLMVLAFSTDTTRVCTLVFANEGSNRPYRHINVPEGHHDLSHHENNPAKQAKIREINCFHMRQLAYIANKMKTTREGDSNLLDNVMLVYGSGNSDGNRHNHDDLPILLLGKGASTIRAGRHIRFGRNTPLNNLWLSMLDRVECQVDRIGDSTGRLTELS
ncbi:MAG: DUF1552 domain-containing protein [Gemmataceae bacterium]|nr:DUF1552 domain-containing protein [Gemmataceae bacterium]